MLFATFWCIRSDTAIEIASARPKHYFYFKHARSNVMLIRSNVVVELCSRFAVVFTFIGLKKNCGAAFAYLVFVFVSHRVVTVTEFFEQKINKIYEKESSLALCLCSKYDADEVE